MRRALSLSAACALTLTLAHSAPPTAGSAAPAAHLPAHLPLPDPRLREVIYDPQAVVTVNVKRGVVTLVVLDPDETITEVASGLGSDCAKPEAVWCVAVPPGGRILFIKPRSRAGEANNLAVVTDRRTHAFRFVVLADADPSPPVYRLLVHTPARPVTSPTIPVHEAPVLAMLAQVPRPLSPAQIVQNRLDVQPPVLNARYSIAEGRGSRDIVPTLVFDDGRFTYMRFPGNRELPAIFQVLGDASEALVNSRMEDELLVVDRVSRNLMLRAGSAVVEVWNDAFDLDGHPPENGTTVNGVRRVVKADRAQASTSPHPGDAR
ncbi:TrbG/VirB9 family P-type conjugative transfer protein [Burkholderiaceae bacterium UC74_6]